MRTCSRTAALARLLVVSALGSGCVVAPPVSSSDSHAADGTPDVPAAIEAPPKQLALQVVSARQREVAKAPEQLEVLVLLANGAGGVPVPLNPALFQVKTSDGLLHAGTLRSGGWVDGPACDASASIDESASTKCRIVFDLGDSRGPSEVRYSAPGALTGQGDARTAKASLTVESCTRCGGVCTYLDRDLSNCGACGGASDGGTPADRSSRASLACQGGKIVCVGADGRATGLTYCDGLCVDLSSDAQHCGACGRKARENAVCTSGQDSCREGYTDCSGACVDLQSDMQHCGACGRPVTPTESNGMNRYCWKGEVWCHPSGHNAYYRDCNGSCANYDKDPKNCGSCGNAVKSGEECVDGKPQCLSGYERCAGIDGCVNLNLDSANCGACGRKCGTSQYCYGGLCWNS